MKRSKINRCIIAAKEFFQAQRFELPPFAFWTPQQWSGVGPEADEIRNHRLGWDLTDFGRGCFDAMGLLLFTLRGGSIKDPTNAKVYAEKIMMVEESQLTPYHFHWMKTEDIINRGGGTLVVELHESDEEGGLTERPVTVRCDGILRTIPSGGRVLLRPGESVTLPPRIYHQFYGEPGTGAVLVGEVSSVNDDDADNCFLEPVSRFPVIEEDEAPLHYLCHEVPPARR